VFLVGTTNLSTLLAKRTQRLIADVQPEAVMVQTNEEWWSAVKLMGYVESQEEFNHYHKHLDKYTQLQSISMWWSTRHPVFWARFYPYAWLWNWHMGFPETYHFTKPGLEIKYALEEGTKQGANLYFLGAEFNQLTWRRLLHETRMNFLHYFWKRLEYMGLTHWEMERTGQKTQTHTSEPHQYAEMNLDSY
jgi:hypothetical protein